MTFGVSMSWSPRHSRLMRGRLTWAVGGGGSGMGSGGTVESVVDCSGGAAVGGGGPGGFC